MRMRECTIMLNQSCKIDVEECWNMLRWNVLYGKVSREQSERETGIERYVERKNFIDDESHKIYINRLRVTDLSYNYKVKMPPSLEEEEFLLDGVKKGWIN